MRRITRPLVPLIVLVSTGCGKDAGPVGPGVDQVVATVTVTPASVVLHDAGETIRLTAVARNASGVVVSGATPAWSVGDAAVVTATADGLLTAAGEGATTVTATVREVAGSAEVTVAYQWSAVAPGSLHACGLRGGKPYCWGVPITGPVLEPGSAGIVTTPTLVETDVDFVAIDSGERHTCGLTGDGSIYCWGQNAMGQLGDGTDVEAATPRPVAGGLRFASMSVGAYHACGLTEDGTAYCWGGGGNASNGRDAALGHQMEDMCVVSAYFSSTCSKTPRPVSGTTMFAQISAGLFHTCAVADDGAAYCWGWNRGMLGNGEDYVADATLAKRYFSPELVLGGHTFTRVSAGNLHSCGITAGGGALCWGGFGINQGQLGRGDFSGDVLPGPVSDLVNVTSIETTKENSIYAATTCALAGGGQAYCWGADAEGQVGSDASMQECTKADVPTPCAWTPVAVEGGLTFQSLESGLEFTCGLTTDRDIYCWGLNTSGQLGNGTTISSTIPSKVAEPSGA